VILGRWALIRVRGRSMEPALRDGAVVLARRSGRAPSRGDVVVLRRPAGAPVPPGAEPRPPDAPAAPAAPWIVKRVAAVAGDAMPAGVPGGTATVPPGFVVVLGDREGFDSRLFGPVPAASVRATVIRALRP
jgi:signal peptidase I